MNTWTLLYRSVDDILGWPKAIGLRACHRLSSLISRNVEQIDSRRIVAGVFTDTSTRILTLYVITNRRGLAHQYIDGLDGEIKTTWLSRRRLLEGRSPMSFPVLLKGHRE